jgi:hypothetical protein
MSDFFNDLTELVDRLQAAREMLISHSERHTQEQRETRARAALNHIEFLTRADAQAYINARCTCSECQSFYLIESVLSDAESVVSIFSDVLRTLTRLFNFEVLRASESELCALVNRVDAVAERLRK